MRVSSGVALIAVALMAGTASFRGSAWSQAPKTWNEPARRDQETRIFVYYVYGGISSTLCTNSGVPPVKLVEPPKNGTTRIDEIDYTPKGCPNPIRATGIFYRPTPGFVGTDRFTVEKGPQGNVIESYEGTSST